MPPPALYNPLMKYSIDQAMFSAQQLVDIWVELDFPRQVWGGIFPSGQLVTRGRASLTGAPHASSGILIPEIYFWDEYAILSVFRGTPTNYVPVPVPGRRVEDMRHRSLDMAQNIVDKWLEDDMPCCRPYPAGDPSWDGNLYAHSDGRKLETGRYAGIEISVGLGDHERNESYSYQFVPTAYRMELAGQYKYVKRDIDVQTYLIEANILANLWKWGGFPPEIHEPGGPLASQLVTPQLRHAVNGRSLTVAPQLYTWHDDGSLVITRGDPDRYEMVEGSGVARDMKTKSVVDIPVGAEGVAVEIVSNWTDDGCPCCERYATEDNRWRGRANAHKPTNDSEWEDGLQVSIHVTEEGSSVVTSFMFMPETFEFETDGYMARI